MLVITKRDNDRLNTAIMEKLKDYNLMEHKLFLRRDAPTDTRSEEHQQTAFRALEEVRKQWFRP
jgi:hypothetical protein